MLHIVLQAVICANVFFAYSGVSATTYHRFITIKILAKTTSAFFSSDSLHLHGHRSAE
jgi:hypothetical protein